MTTEIIKKPKIVNETSGVDIQTLLTLAVKQEASIETMERLFALQQSIQKQVAESQFNHEMASLQSKMPMIKKLKQGPSNMYAPLEDTIAQTKEIISIHGFTYSWDTKYSDSEMTVTCIVTHELGHKTYHSVTSKLSEGTKMNSEPQKAAITITYLKRYSFENAFGIQTAGEDMDGRIKDQVEVTEDKIEEHRAKLHAVTGLTGLKTVWANLPMKAKIALEGDYKEIAKKFNQEEKPTSDRPAPIHPNKLTI